MKTILMKLAGPLQSWGTNSHYENRQTNRFPSKSAIIGMIAAAMGYRRDENKKLDELRKLSFAVRVDQQGDILRDFQIAISHKPNGERLRSYVTNRYYLQDAVFVVAIGSEDEALIDKINDSLKRPYFQLYLGRKSCPINTDYLSKDYNPSDQGVIESLTSLQWKAANWYQRRCINQGLKPVYICADSNLLDDEYYQMIRDIPYSFAQGETSSPYNTSDRREYRLRSIGYLNNINVKPTV
ncbi:type I-E CRISPR-associated protein Cas5/CasD [Apilactobacillus timberlakei]|uniref:type I-E CRISPR-associated protein Cas5/CasD n=1 Tax=Apilactobacillus timberlakei TaxID=2008380 RepID=UPI001126B0D9|nr:type I-E CRISPR-associated protein Cas5/CasD [Apilactobacillus timberlakei]TPR19560.1 type I-E CRISPR-associated protein Cas5/CasD [Apilactobacillus timberlakei]TPR20537.1 type I-E CRISPR-associated protein Cas5/CasD [Apilactobacillus timberlakei]TPR22581.1 type I-E CRISPR-associated protein Cas5/CasD [Apilactobacillus timberlakei]